MQKQRERVDFHVKIKPKLRADFKQYCIERGFSTCFMLETLIQGLIAGATRTSEAHPSSSLTINQKIEYLVEKPRRRKVGVLHQHLENCYLNGCWTYRRPEKGETLSRLHHVPECVCGACKPFESQALKRIATEKRLHSLKV